MPTVYEIEGDLISRVSREVHEVGRVQDMLPLLMTYHPIEMGRLPKDCAYVSAKPIEGTNQVEAQILVIQPPQTREVIFNESGASEDSRTAYKLQMPYFGFWFRMNGSPINENDSPTAMLWAPRSWGIFWARRPFEGTDKPRYARSAMMPNSWGDTRVCFGNNPISGTLTLGAHIDRLINTYWTSEFNTDLEVYTPYPGRRPRSRLRAWHNDDRGDAWMNWDIWDGNELSLQDLIGSVAGYDAFMEPAPDSTEPIVPQPPTQRTWHSIRDWAMNDLTEDQRARMASVLADLTSV